MAAAFGTDAVALGIGFTVYLLTMAGLIPLAGWLADRLGAREVLVAAIVGFAAASLLCGLSTEPRRLHRRPRAAGAAAALMVPVGRNLVLQSTPKSGVMAGDRHHHLAGADRAGRRPVHRRLDHHAFRLAVELLRQRPALPRRRGPFLALVPRQPRAEPRPFDWPGFLLVSGGMVLVVAGLEAFVARHAAPRRRAARCGRSRPAGSPSATCAARGVPLVGLDVLAMRSFALATLAAGTFGRIAVNATPVPAAAPAAGRLRHVRGRDRLARPRLLPRQPRDEIGDHAADAPLRLPARC